MTARDTTTGIAASPGRALSPRWRSHEGSGFTLFELPGFLSGQECDRMIALIDQDRTPSATFETMPDQEHRTSETCWMNHADPLVENVFARICAELGFRPSTGERMQGQRYGPGQQFKPHHDFIRPDRPHWQHQAKLGGQRTWTAMIFLNVPQEGGDTNFPAASLRLSPSLGTLIAWHNLTESGEPNHFSLHEGCAVTSGEKYIVTQWFRERPCRTPGFRAGARRVAARLLGAKRLLFR
jgi:prolyl 4-hydroxylase